MKSIILALVGFGLVVQTQAAEDRTAMSESVLLNIIRDNQVTELDQVPALLPRSFRSNFTLKHGLMVAGPRGHLAETDIPGLGQHSEPLSPRAFVFDPYTGFAISYNGGTTSDRSTPQEGGQSLDTMSFNFATKEFRLVKIDFPLPEPGQASVNSQNCTLCHGPNNRPIFSMYPDWPRFYGSDNDELRLGQPGLDGQMTADFSSADAMTLLRREIQMREFNYFHEFKNSVVQNHPRYSPLFDLEAYRVLGFTGEMYSEYPYRSDVEQPGVSLDASDVSRAFARRAGLRFNLLYSRLLVQQVVHKITEHPRFERLGELFVYNLMRCGPETRDDDSVLRAWSAELTSILSQVESAREIPYQQWNPLAADPQQRLTTVGYFQLNNGGLQKREDGSLLHYGEALALFGLKINDVDMRFTYHHEAYRPDQAYRDLCRNMPEGQDCGDQVMHVGYLQNSYFNAYNDGSTTMDEHLVANLLTQLAQSDAALADYLKKRGAYAIRGLLNKYSGPTFEDRLVLDREFFTQMDKYSKWFSLPYPMQEGYKTNPKSLYNLHHRAPFGANYRESYDGVCAHLKKRLLAKAGG